ncbi:MAG: protein kinase [Polyangiaceae bacterium]|nr:protein kinase [Polyangiaceae bacterium]MCW5789677.1 protein kinase [Polyangiaceae bacterium]
MEAPTRLADFEIIRRLGTGGMAEVFLAKRRGAEGTFKLLVVKRILPQHIESARFRTMFAEEAQLATRLNHPNIVQVYDFQDYGDEGQLLSMEYVEGPDLRKLQRAAKAQQMRIPPYIAAYIVGEIAKGLHYAHMRKDERGEPLDIVHRDVSPQNVLLSFEGAVKIADFGIATANVFRDEPGVLMGKTSYMSPEQARAERVDRRTDIYSLGVVFHELLTGRPLHGAAEGHELLELVRSGHVEPPSTYARGVPSELEAITMRALSREPSDRFQTARDLAGAITRALFAKQEVVDSHSLEGVIEQLVGREHTSPGVEAPAASSSVSELPPSVSMVEGSRPRFDEPTGPGVPKREAQDRVGREVRHVAIVTLKLHGGPELAEAIGMDAARRFGEQLRGTLDEMAFKRGARWSWSAIVGDGVDPLQSSTARAVVGLMANPARAAADAGMLAADLHEFLEGACDDLPVGIRASLGIVRGIAAGRRDAAGHLIQHELQKNADYLARLLVEQAPPGATWVAGGLYRLVRRDFIWGDAPTIQLDDADQRQLPRNMRIYALERPLTHEERQQANQHAPRDLVGRDSELADLHAAYHRAASPGPAGQLGKVTARVVVGELGIGKTALVSSFLGGLPPDARVLRVECTPARTELPFASTGDWLREMTGARPDQTVDEAVLLVEELLGEFAHGPHGAEIVRRLAEVITGNLADADDEAEVAHNRRLISSGLRRFFARSAVEAPFVVVVEGLQWCDRPSLELLTHLIRREDPLPILALLVTRPSDRVTPFINGIVRIDLHGLSTDNQVRLLQTHLGCEHGVRTACAELFPRAAGNPFFLLEMVDAFLEKGVFELREREDQQHELALVEGRHGEFSLKVPSTLEQLIADRLGELPPEEHRVVEWLGVAGGPLRVGDLIELAGAGAEDSITRLCARGMCDEREGVVDVRHPLARDVAYLGIEPSDSSRMHLALAEHLVARGAARGLSAAIVARHFSRGKQRSRASDFYLEAATAARASYQLKLSARYLRRALDGLPEGDARRLRALEMLEAICRIRGSWRERRKYLSALRALAKESGSAHWVALALIRTARLDLDDGRLQRGLSAVQQAERVAEVAGSPVLQVQAQALTAEILRDLGDMQGALGACDRAIRSAQSSEVPPRRRADVLRTRGTLLRRVGRVHEAVEAHAEAIAVFRQAGARRQEARTKNALAYAMFVLGRFEDAIALAMDSMRIDTAIGGLFQMAKTMSNIGQSYARLGDIPRALAYLKRAREAHERYGDQDGRADTLLSSAFVLLEAGDVDAAQNLVGDAGALIAVTSSTYDSVHERILRALLARHAGDSGTAVMHAFDARQAAEPQAYVAFHFFAMAIEAAARADIGEHHMAILLATTAMGAIGTVQGSEYGLETRALCCEAVEKAGSPQAAEFLARAREHAQELLDAIRDKHARKSFRRRKLVAALLGAESEEPASEAREDALLDLLDKGSSASVAEPPLAAEDPLDELLALPRGAGDAS